MQKFLTFTFSQLWVIILQWNTNQVKIRYIGLRTDHN